jgi:hypothetical protein
LEELHQKPFQMERIRWEGQNFSEVVVPEEEEEEEEQDDAEAEEEESFPSIFVLHFLPPFLFHSVTPPLPSHL